MTEATVSEEDVYVLTDDFVRDVQAGLDGESPGDVIALVEPLHAADLADLVELLGRANAGS